MEQISDSRINSTVLMSKVDSPEDRKLFASKSWSTRSSSSATLQNASVSNEASFGTSTSKEGVIESESGFASLRSLPSMRRSKISGEVEKEAGAGSPAMTNKNSTPLTPSTPLKWKSNSRELQEEVKVMERSRLGSAVLVGNTFEGCLEGNPVVENGKEERANEGQQQVLPADEADENRATSSVDELSTSIQAGITDEDFRLESIEGPDRKTSSGDDVMMKTIDFLRARLLSERSASKTANFRNKQLADKVSELEEKLGLANADRIKAEASAEEAFMRLKIAEGLIQGINGASGEVPDRSISILTKSSPLSRSRAGPEDIKPLELDGTSNKDLSGTNSYRSSVDDRDFKTKRSLSETMTKAEERTAEQGSLGVIPAPQNMSENSQGLPQKQENRAVIESRLQDMWNKICDDMTALVEERRHVVREELMSWIGQVPAVVQNTMPKELVSPTHDVDSRLESDRLGLLSVTRPMMESQPEISSDIVQVKVQLQAEPRRTSVDQEQFASQERNSLESPRKIEQFTGHDLCASSSAVTSNASLELQHANDTHGPDGVVDKSLFLGSPLARLAKAKSTSDLSTSSNGYISGTNSPHLDESCVQLAEDGYWSAILDFKGDNDLGNSGRHHQAQTRYEDVNSQTHKDNYYRQGDRERDESYVSPQPENTYAHRHRHRHQRLRQKPHSENFNSPVVEDFGLPYQQPIPNPGLARRQSYSGYPPSMTANPRSISFEKPPGSTDDLRYGVKRTYGADGLRRNSSLAAKAITVPGKLTSNQTSMYGSSIAKPTLSLGYGPAYDAPPMENSPVQQSPKGGLDRNISDLLRALQVAKATIQKGGSGVPN